MFALSTHRPIALTRSAYASSKRNTRAHTQQQPFHSELLKSAQPVDLSFETFGPSLSSSGSSCGPSHPPLVILHGLFGSKSNWRSIAKKLTERLDTRVYTVDLRNHGASPSAPSSSYIDYAKDIQKFLDDQGLDQVNLIGHSMGGKVAMTLGLLNSLEKDGSNSVAKTEASIKNLVVIDISPCVYPPYTTFRKYLAIMKTINQAKVQSRKVADQIFSQHETDPSVRQFLLTNLIKAEDSYQFRLPLEILENVLDTNQIGAFPFDSSSDVVFQNSSLFIKGKKSRYIDLDSHLPLITKFFPKFGLIELDTDHWVHAEKPREVIDIITDFVQE